MVSRDVTYVNGITAAIGGNAAGERVLVVVAVRVTGEAVDAAAAAKTPATTATTSSSSSLRLLRKERVGGPVLQQVASESTGTSKVGSAAGGGKVTGAASGKPMAAAALMADLTGALYDAH